MDANRFDTLAKALTSTQSRRSALGAAIAGGVLSALGLNRATPARAAQDDLCVLAGSGGTCVLDFEAILRVGPSARQPLVPGGSPGSLRGYLIFTQGPTGTLDDAALLLEDGSRLPVAGLAIGQGFQARIDLGQGRALVAVGVGEQDFTRCLGRLDGTVTSTESGDLGEWHALAGVQNIPTAAGGSPQSEGSGNRPASSVSGSGNPPAQGNTTTGGSGGNTTLQEDGARPLSETRDDQPASDSSGGGSGSESGGDGGNTDNGDSSSGSADRDRPATNTDNNRPASETGDERASVEVLQASDDAEPVLACPEGQTRCSNICIDTTSDVFNCGACDRICALDEECTDGQCLAMSDDEPDANADTNDAETDAVDDTETDVLTDDEGNACEAGETLCGDVCTDLQTDVIHCGACGNTCSVSEECLNGTCAPPAPVLCPAGQIRCDGICREAVTNFGSEGVSCPGGGGVPTECPPGQVLCNGACFPEGRCQPTECQPGWGYCYGVCRDFQNDPGYCGGCNSGCTGNGYCQGGTCTSCSSALMACGADCVDIKTDLNNCGGCGNLCGTQCIDGQCTAVGPAPGCAPGTTRCGEACVDLTRSFNNCGQCGKKCDSNNWECAPPGVCRLREEYCEQEGKHSCGTYCSDLDDADDCGECGYYCINDNYCKNGLCYILGSEEGNVGKKPLPPQDRELPPAGQQTLAPTDEVTCASGLDACAGACTDLSSDSLNCGACGNPCGAGDVCQQGQCSTPGSTSGEQTLAPGDDEPQTEPAASEPETDAETASPTCPEGQADCGGVCADLSLDPLNCGDCGVACGPGSSCSAGVCSGNPAPADPEAVEPELEPDVAPILEPDPELESEPVLETEPAQVLEPESNPVVEPELVLEPETGSAPDGAEAAP